MNPVEALTLAYIHSVQGDYEPIEPQVYDLMLPESIRGRLQLSVLEEICRVTFDAEALADYPEAQLLAFGHPTLDQIFAMAHQQGCVGQIYLTGFNLQPHQLLQKMRQQVHIPKEWGMEFGESRLFHFTSWFYWFQSTLVSDEKVQYLFEVGMDQYYGRVTRRLKELLEYAQIVEEAPIPYPDVPGGISLLDGYLLAKKEALEKLRLITRGYTEKLNVHLVQETDRIRKYFEGMQEELGERKKKAEKESKEVVGIEQQQTSLQLEKEMRILDLHKKMTLKVHFKLEQLLFVKYPKILTPARILPKRGNPSEVVIVWNPHMQAIEPLSCPGCRRPTLQFVEGARGAVECLQCRKI